MRFLIGKELFGVTARLDTLADREDKTLHGDKKHLQTQARP